jgi:hypothetical protein
MLAPFVAAMAVTLIQLDALACFHASRDPSQWQKWIYVRPAKVGFWDELSPSKWPD